jgi:hypothetical protein
MPTPGGLIAGAEYGGYSMRQIVISGPRGEMVDPARLPQFEKLRESG